MDRVTPGVIALVLGGFLAVLLVIPYLAVVYRRRGELGFGFVLLSFGALVYALALACYATLPLPGDVSGLCLAPPSPQLTPGRSLIDIRDDGIASAGDLLRSPAFLQVALNVVFFIPLGMLVRHLFRRGVLVTLLLGFAVSLFIELTQLTGIWFLYPCAYRLFDVDDLITNTAGALLGAALAPVLRILPGQRTRGDADEPRPVTAGRRLLAMLLDALSVMLLSSMVLIATRVALLTFTGELPDAGRDSWPSLLSTGTALAASFLVVLASGRTLGEAVVRLEPVRRPGLLRSALRWLLGIGGYQLLLAGLVPLSELVLVVFVLASVIMVFTTRGHRGLAYRLTGQELADSRRDEASRL